MNERLRARIAEADGAGELAEGCRGSAEHPICGDLMQIDVRVEDGKVSDLRWKAQGCPATMAVASVLREAWVGASVHDVESSLRRRLESLGGLEVHERHAEKLALRALREALRGVSG